MQTGTSKGMQTMEQALSDLVVRGIVTLDDALSRSSRPEQLFGLLERAGVDVSSKQTPGTEAAAPLAAGLRVAEA
jgi:twitching motility protein PilT